MVLQLNGFTNQEESDIHSHRQKEVILYLQIYTRAWTDTREWETDRQTCFNETRNCCVKHYNHSVWPASKDEGWAWTHNDLHDWTHARTHTHRHTHTRTHAHMHTQWIVQPIQLMATRAMCATQCAKQCCPHREETSCSLGLKSSAGALFGNRAIFSDTKNQMW